MKKLLLKEDDDKNPNPIKGKGFLSDEFFSF